MIWTLVYVDLGLLFLYLLQHVFFSDSFMPFDSIVDVDRL